MNVPTCKALAVILGCAFATTAFAAARIEKVEPSSPSVNLEGGKAVVKFTIGGTADGNDNCGFWVDYGDGGSPDTRILSKSDGLFPRTLEHTFSKAGSFTVQVKGQRVKTTLGCNGEASAVVNVVAPAAASKAGKAEAAKGAAAQQAAVAAPACPEGWQLQEKSVDKRTGAFACAPKMPEKKLECGPGLSYYQSASAVGCRKGK